GEHWPELGERFDARFRARPLVEAQAALVKLDFTLGQIRHSFLELDGSKLGLESTGFERANRLLMRAQRERVLVFATHLPALGHLLGSKAHAESDSEVLIVQKNIGVERWCVPTHWNFA